MIRVLRISRGLALVVSVLIGLSRQAWPSKRQRLQRPPGRPNRSSSKTLSPPVGRARRDAWRCRTRTQGLITQ